MTVINVRPTRLENLIYWLSVAALVALHLWIAGPSATALVFGLALVCLLRLLYEKIWLGARSRWHYLLSMVLIVSLWRSHFGLPPTLVLLFLIQSVLLLRLSEEQEPRWLAANFLCATAFTCLDFGLALQVVLPAAAVPLSVAWKNRFANSSALNFALMSGAGLGSGWALVFLGGVFGVSSSQLSLSSSLPTLTWAELLSQNQLVLYALAVFVALYIGSRRRPRPLGAPSVWHRHFLVMAACSLSVTAIFFTPTQFVESLVVFALIWLSLWGLPSMALTNLQAKILALSGIGLMALTTPGIIL